jgi:hypothetical protein
MEKIELSLYKKNREFVKKLKELSKDTKSFKIIMNDGHDLIVIPVLKEDDPTVEVEKPVYSYSNNYNGYNTTSGNSTTSPSTNKSGFDKIASERRRDEFSKKIQEKGSTVGAIVVGDVDIWEKESMIFYTYDPERITTVDLLALSSVLKSMYPKHAIISEPNAMPPGKWTSDPLENGWVWLDY